MRYDEVRTNQKLYLFSLSCGNKYQAQLWIHTTFPAEMRIRNREFDSDTEQ